MSDEEHRDPGDEHIDPKERPYHDYWPIVFLNADGSYHSEYRLRHFSISRSYKGAEILAVVPAQYAGLHYRVMERDGEGYLSAGVVGDDGHLKMYSENTPIYQQRLC